ncbi:MAG TPA: helix-turn-helix transcriptional regulator [Streptosporangiaceae bacterium]|nr:helix-turn-helix transcriptional regulator [Streptosporangiaceae bacterium]
MTEATHPATVPQWTLGDRMRKARETAGLKQTDMAEDLGIGRSSIINYESDKAQPPRSVLIAWALRCGVDYEWLSGEPIFSRAGGIRKARSLTQETRAILYTLAA